MKALNKGKQFPQISETKLRNGVFDGKQILEMMKNNRKPLPHQ